MKSIKNIGLIIFFIGLSIFTISPLMGSFVLTEDIMSSVLNENELSNLSEPFKALIVGKEYPNSASFSSDILAIYNDVNNQFKANQEWDKVMWTSNKEFAFNLSKASSNGYIANHKWLMLLLTFGLGILGSLIFITQDLKLLGAPGIKNDGIYHTKLQNRSWVGVLTAVWLITFYILLYFYPYVLVNLTTIVDPLKSLFIKDAQASQWFLYGILYCTSMIVMGIRMFIKYRHNKYQHR